jgi:transketolase
MKNAFITSLEKLAHTNRDIFLLTGDLGFNAFEKFKELYPERFVNVGIAESNMIGVAAGLALSGKAVYCYSLIPFLIMRSFERIRVNLCYDNANVKLIGAGGGFSYGFEGMTHHAIEDISIMRSLPGMTIVAPGDAEETQAVLEASVDHQGPLYIRLGKNGESHVHQDVPKLEIGKGIVIRDGSDICIIATGSMLFAAKVVSDELAKMGRDVRLVSMHTVKPMDEELVKMCASDCSAIFTIEEHSINGGLGTAVSEHLMELSYKGLFKKIGLPDEYSSHIGNIDHLLEMHNLTPKSIKTRILMELERRQKKIDKTK